MVISDLKELKKIRLCLKILLESFQLYVCCVVNIVSFSCKEHWKEEEKDEVWKTSMQFKQ